ncbi:hypothetical protein GCM10020220_084050 [Nonomuraea rubra]|uniref:hypothetical protein n=1 Tax=Nonomuraea rubra TaxID=46180 RepID=UPI0031E94FEE
MTDDGRRRDGPRLSTPVMLLGGILVTVVVLSLDLATGTAVRLFPLLIFLPAIVSALGEVWQTVLASVWVILVEIVIGLYVGAQTDDVLLAAGFMAVFGTLSALGCRYGCGARRRCTGCARPRRRCSG